MARYSKQADREDRSFHDGLVALVDSGRQCEYSPMRQAYVGYVLEAMGWWIFDQGKSGQCPPGDRNLTPRNRIILAWARATKKDLVHVSYAINAQAKHTREHRP